MNSQLYKKLCLGSLLVTPLVGFAQTSPNFVLIIADDVSFNDILIQVPGN
jgi:hypothetical protein